MEYDANDYAEIQELRDRITTLEFQVVGAKSELEMELFHQQFRIKEIENLKKELREMKGYAMCYKRLQEAVLASPTLMQEWERFCVMLKLSDPDIHKYRIFNSEFGEPYEGMIP